MQDHSHGGDWMLHPPAVNRRRMAHCSLMAGPCEDAPRAARHGLALWRASPSWWASAATVPRQGKASTSARDAPGQPHSPARAVTRGFAASALGTTASGFSHERPDGARPPACRRTSGTAHRNHSTPALAGGRPGGLPRLGAGVRPQTGQSHVVQGAGRAGADRHPPGTDRAGLRTRRDHPVPRRQGPLLQRHPHHQQLVPVCRRRPPGSSG